MVLHLNAISRLSKLSPSLFPLPLSRHPVVKTLKLRLTTPNPKAIALCATRRVEDFAPGLGPVSWEVLLLSRRRHLLSHRPASSP